MKKRNPVIDIMKGIGIVLVVYGHCDLPGTRAIYLFHMALFILISGSLFKSESVDAPKRYLSKKVKSLYLPFVAVNAVFTLLNNSLIRIGFYTTNPLVEEINATSRVHAFLNAKETAILIAKATLFHGGSQLGGTTWFLRTLFGVSVLYAFVTFCLKKTGGNERIIQGCVSAFLLLAGYFLMVKGVALWGFDTVCSAYWLFHAGRYGGDCLRKIGESFSNLYIRLAVVAGCGALLIAISRNVHISLGNNAIGNPFLYVFVSLTGYLGAYLAALSCVNRGAGKLFAWLGRHSMAVMLFHFTVFKFVNAGIAYARHLPRYMIAAFPALEGNSRMGLAYVALGTLIPCAVSEGIGWAIRRSEVREA